MKLKLLSIGVLLLTFFSGCSATYDEDKVIHSIQEICLNEYGIDNVNVEITGKTLGVYLPLDQLFSVDYEKFLSGEMGGDIENLVQFDPKALEIVEDVLFSLSRVILSTSRPIDFYVLNATDTTVTGLQFTIIGNVLDMKRVRFWDISRDEYRKRLINNISFNQSVIWKKNVLRFFDEISQTQLEKVVSEFTFDPKSFLESSAFFIEQLQEIQFKPGIEYEVLEIKAKHFKNDEVIVYAKVKETFDEAQVTEPIKFENGFVGEYLFLLKLKGLEFKISQVIPFYYIDESGEISAITFPEELQIYQNINEWPKDFEFTDISLESFLSQQLTKRAQGVRYENVQFQSELLPLKKQQDVNFFYEYIAMEQGGKETEGYFVFQLFLRPRDKIVFSMQDVKTDPLLQEYLKQVLKDFSFVLRSYSFDEYSHLDIQLPVSNDVLMLTKKQIENFRKNKLSISELLNEGQVF